MTAEAKIEAVPDTPVPDLEEILPEPGRIVIDGIQCEVARLKSREFLLLMRVLTNGLGQGLQQARLSLDDPETMQAELLALLMLAIPNAIEEFGAFLLSIVKPVSEKDRAAVGIALENPDPDVLIDVFGTLALQEKDDLTALAGKAGAWRGKIGQAMKSPGAQQRKPG